VQIVPGARVGFVGRNGAGKSTLFQAIRGETAAGDPASIAIPPRWRIGSLAQEAPDGPESLIDVVLAADRRARRAAAEAETAHRPASHRRHPDPACRYRRAFRAGACRGHPLGPRLSAADQLRRSEFSGGWRMRVALAATLFAAPDLLLLDEPTNYLDLEGTLWLEDHLANYPRTVIVISHDRDLLDTSVDQILHLERGKLTLYKGTYSSFEEQRATREMLDAKHASEADLDERKRLQAFVDRFKAKASKAKQAQSRVKMLERMKPVTALVTRRARDHIPGAGENALAADHRGRWRLGRIRSGQACAEQGHAAHRQRRPHRPARLQRQRQIDAGETCWRQARAVFRQGRARRQDVKSPISRSISSMNSISNGTPYTIMCAS
jgi:ATP-binding cassette subfamily F protein 3